jgi:hypothetical protein
MCTQLEAALAAASDTEQQFSAAQSELRAAEAHAAAAVELRGRVSALEQQLESSRSEAAAAVEAGRQDAAAAAAAASQDAEARVQAVERRLEEAAALTAAAQREAAAAAERAQALEVDLAGVRAELEQALRSAAVSAPLEGQAVSNGHADLEAPAAELASAKEVRRTPAGHVSITRWLYNAQTVTLCRQRQPLSGSLACLWTRDLVSRRLWRVCRMTDFHGIKAGVVPPAGFGGHAAGARRSGQDSGR